MKLKELQEFLRTEKLDAALFVTYEYKDDAALRYLAQTPVDTGALIVPDSGQPELLIPGFEYDRIKRIAPVKTVCASRWFETIVKRLGHAKDIGINGDIFAVSEQRVFKHMKRGIRFIDISDSIAELRVRKTPAELKLTAESCTIACEIMDDCINKLGRFKTEQDVARFLIQKTVAADCELAFPPIVASGPNAATPHHLPASKLHPGFCVIDFGVRWNGYCSDMTRTAFMGKPTRKEQEAYELLLHVQTHALDKLLPDVDYGLISRQAQRELGPWGRYFIHRLGHSVGLWVHDVVPRSMWERIVLDEGMVWTVEPGIYVPKKFGMRIEDTAVVTDDGHRVLTEKTPKELAVIPF